MEMNAQVQLKCVEYIATEEKPFQFTDSGLDNVYLVGIKYFVYEDGRTVAEIPALKQLLKLIAKDLVFSSSGLNGSEIRFLRKRLGTKSVDMAARLRIELETLSRIENGKQPVSPQIDLLTRMVYCVLSGDPELIDHCKSVIEIIRQEIEKNRNSKVITMKISEDQKEWRDLPKVA